MHILTRRIGLNDTRLDFEGRQFHPLCLTETPVNSLHSELIVAIREFNLVSAESAPLMRIQKYGLSPSSPPDSLLRYLTKYKKEMISTIPLVNALLQWLDVVVRFYKRDTQMTEITSSITAALSCKDNC